MPLIDRSYFAGGELNLPGLNRIEIQENLDLLIVKRETELLTLLLGVKMYDDFIQGLGDNPIEQRWTDLLQGLIYEDGTGNFKKWRGLVSAPLSTVNAVNASNTIEVKVGRGGPYDPVDGTSSVTIPPAVVGKEFQFWLRGIGPLGEDEYSVVGNTLTLLPSDYGENVFHADTYANRYQYVLPTLAINTTTGDNKESLIANYVYYWYLRKEATQTTTVGEVATETENAVRVTPMSKMARAWNEMVVWIWEMYEFIEARSSDYPTLRRDYDSKWRTVNTANL